MSSQTLRPLVRIHADDNVCVAARPLPVGIELGSEGFVTHEAIPQGHKVATRAIEAGAAIIKYGQPIGIAQHAIHPGQWVHSHNVTVGEHTRRYEFASELSQTVPADPLRTFEGFRRASGRAGTRNYIAVISSVNCSASVSKLIARHFTSDRLADYPRVDGVVALTHPGGCAMQFAGQQHQLLNRVLGGMARHPNIGGYLLVGLGCEKATIEYLVEDQQLVQIEGAASACSKAPHVLTMQNLGGTAKTVTAGIRQVEQLLPAVDRFQREPVPASELVVATQCGGSDGNSGITANPAVGDAADQIVAQGGTVILGETTEIAGAEHLLTRRAVSADVGHKLLDKLKWWQWYAGIFGERFDDNRSAGNAAGGLTTIAEKSLGAIAKAGSSPLVAVYDYAETIQHKGLVIMDSPGFDPCSITGMVAGGANLVVFTTGRGSCYGCKPVPSLKVATNTPMYQRMIDDMDVNAGRILEGTSVAEVGREILQRLLAVASGEKTKSEAQGLGDEEFVPWMIGPIL